MSSLPIKWMAAEYQKEAVQFILDHPRCMLWLEPGLGKTSITLEALRYKKETEGLGKILILAPLRVCRLVWPLEIAKWRNFNHLSYSILHGSKKHLELKKDVDIYLLNYEGIPWLINHLKDAPAFDCIVFDELSKLKAHNTKRFVLTRNHLMDIPLRIGLTGSPAANSLMGLFGETFVIDGGITFGRYITRFRNQYFWTPMNQKYKFIPKDGAKAQIYEKLSWLTMRLDAEECVEMPKLIKQNIVIELPKPAQRMYTELEKDFITYVTELDKIRCRTAAAKCLKLQQVASGACYPNSDDPLPTEEAWHVIHNEKLDALKDLIEELKGVPLLVIYEFIHERERILEALPGTPCLGSNLTKEREISLQDRWNRGEIPVMVGHAKSMGHGLNLQSAGNHICFTSTTYDYELYDQTIRRIYRRGAKYPYVFVHHIVAKNTIDEVILLKLRDKKSTQNDLFEKVKEQVQLRNQHYEDN